MSRAGVRLTLVFLLVAAVLWVPAAVRATGSVRTPASSIIRLNRGFDVPVEKELVTPADAPPVPAADAHDDADSTVATTLPAEPRDALPDSPDIVAPDLLRGPPSAPLA